MHRMPPYRYLPNVIVQPKTVDRGGHLSILLPKRPPCDVPGRWGQPEWPVQSDDILIDVRQHWSGWEVEDNGSRIRCKVGKALGRIDEA
jgi:hypothetical protein